MWITVCVVRTGDGHIANRWKHGERNAEMILDITGISHVILFQFSAEKPGLLNWM
jgi:hypothetical protein